ncbi:hypothetical protein BE15_21265 [Sorangium cellulosum]|uniref:Uncharacterized protein n=1 Tax=Sorangium cellulosum TaxID=56 RepID=A0A150Q4I5_SORCE|nr:hypothetical protein BE15_21265 [Sorangium cellulosum]
MILDTRLLFWRPDTRGIHQQPARPRVVEERRHEHGGELVGAWHDGLLLSGRITRAIAPKTLHAASGPAHTAADATRRRLVVAAHEPVSPPGRPG